VLDFQKVKAKEREEAKKLFSGKEAESLKKEIMEAAEKMGIQTELEAEKIKQERIRAIQVFL